MPSFPSRSLLLRTTLFLAIFVLLTACGDESSTSSIPESPSTPQTQLHLSWLPHPDETTTGYLVHYGPTLDTTTVVISDLPVNSSNFDPQNPSVEYSAWDDLRLRTGDNACFRLKAYNPDGE